MRLTIIVTLLLIAVLVLFDVWTLATRGYETTISWMLVYASRDNPIIPFVFGVVAGHLFWGHHAKLEEKK